MRASADIDRRRRRDEIEDADVAVQIEGALDLRQIVGAAPATARRRAARRRPRRPRDRAGRDRRPAERGETATVIDVHQRATWRASAARRSEPESTAARARDRSRDPGRHRARRSRRPTCRSPAPSSHGSMRAAVRRRPAIRRPAPPPSRGQEQLRVGREALGQRVPEHDRQRDRRQHETHRPQHPGRDDEQHRRRR